MHRLEASWLERPWGQGYVTKRCLLVPIPEAAAGLLASILISLMYMVAMHGQPDACVVLLIVPKTELYEMCCMHLIFVHMNCLLCDLGIRKTKKVNPKN
jgi:hypothetical protein